MEHESKRKISGTKSEIRESASEYTRHPDLNEIEVDNNVYEGTMPDWLKTTDLSMSQAYRVQSYLNEFTQAVYPYAEPKQGLETEVYPFRHGVVLKFSYTPNSPSATRYNFKKNFDDICRLSQLEIREFLTEQEYQGFVSAAQEDRPFFSKTSIFHTDSSVILIKDWDIDEWIDDAATNDASRVINQIPEFVIS